MSVSGLKAELKFLASIFDKNHERFRIVSWKLDELHCQFLLPPPSPPGSPHSPPPLTLHCNITASESVFPMWNVPLTPPPSVLPRLTIPQGSSRKSYSVPAGIYFLFLPSVIFTIYCFGYVSLCPITIVLDFFFVSFFL
ncbi:ubiquitin-conjugating enzyme E2 Q2-like [Leptonychotes weddellii]|uniref:Ubiquitin-conjugating enzyme E2 Q2-like n=1 Tax=Leptonychotes weddellii TaxID=9713 RepID=A0A7F8QCF0_LEPWE|nr:ubiquitin-conjugating enzyme E2 Q2-like [Leptonychotes weddellii]